MYAWMREVLDGVTYAWALEYKTFTLYGTTWCCDEQACFWFGAECATCGELASRHTVTEDDPSTLTIALRCQRMRLAEDVEFAGSTLLADRS